MNTEPLSDVEREELMRLRARARRHEIFWNGFMTAFVFSWWGQSLGGFYAGLVGLVIGAVFGAWLGRKTTITP